MNHTNALERIAKSDFLLLLRTRWVVMFCVAVAVPVVAIEIASWWDRLLFVRLMHYGFGRILFVGGSVLGVFAWGFLRRRVATFRENGFKYKFHREKDRSEIHIEADGRPGAPFAMLAGLSTVLPDIMSALPPGHPVLLATPWLNIERADLTDRLERRLVAALPHARITRYEGCLPLIEHLCVRFWWFLNKLRSAFWSGRSGKHYAAFAAMYPNAWRRTPANGFVISA